MDYILIVIAAVAVVVIPLALYIAFGCKHSSELTLNEMRDCERKIQNDQRYQTLINLGSCDAIAKELKLKIKEDSEALEKDGYDSCLCSIEDPEYYGVIKYRKSNNIDNTGNTKDNYLRNFRCYHEIIHYLWDVGIGQKVTKCYGKDQKGETKSHREQIINYMAAAIAVPKKSLLKEISKYENESREDMIQKLSEIFKQPREAIERRIKEVEFLS